ncbi:MAG: peptidylprolyl isomerase [Candidatus Nitrosopelagicus sp.]|nr:peptidylprolyl isomerase [Candidatus Nitrosopelagicus sp.]
MNRSLFLIPLALSIIALTPQAFAESNDSVAVLETHYGNIVIEFFPDYAPNHVENFLKLTKDGTYDGTIFHRIIPGFMVQGGDPLTAEIGISLSRWGTGDPGYSIDAEFNDISHERGIVSMARSNDPNSAGSQFFIVHKDSTHLDGQYTVFGRIITQESFETLDKIAELETGPNNQPLNGSLATLIKITIKDRNEITDILDQKLLTKSDAQLMKTTPELYTNNYLGISFNSPVGWLIQSPPKTEPSVPDLVILGPQTSSSSPAVSITIDGTSGTLEDEVQKLQNTISPLISQNVLKITDEGQTSVDNIFAYILRATGSFENLNDEVREIGFSTILFVDDNRVYTIQYTNHLSDYYNYEDEVSDIIQSFKLIHSGPSSSQESQSESVTLEEWEGEDSSEGGGCLIATAAFGSEMAPQVQFLREIRDGTVMTTQSGTAFMTGFNQFYYSFSPYVADYERENPVFKEAIKVTLTPLLTSLTLLNYVDVDTEEEMLGYGIGIILLNIGMYFVAPAAVIIAIKNRLK